MPRGFSGGPDARGLPAYRGDQTVSMRHCFKKADVTVQVRGIGEVRGGRQDLLARIKPGGGGRTVERRPGRANPSRAFNHDRAPAQCGCSSITRRTSFVRGVLECLGVVSQPGTCERSWVEVGEPGGPWWSWRSRRSCSASRWPARPLVVNDRQQVSNGLAKAIRHRGGWVAAQGDHLPFATARLRGRPRSPLRWI